MTEIDKNDLEASRQELREAKSSRKVTFAEEMGIRMKPYMLQSANDVIFTALERLDKYLKGITGESGDDLGKSVKEIREDLNSFIADQTDANEEILTTLEEINERVGGESSDESSSDEQETERAAEEAAKDIEDDAVYKGRDLGTVLETVNKKLNEVKKEKEAKDAERQRKNEASKSTITDFIKDIVLIASLKLLEFFGRIHDFIKDTKETIQRKIDDIRKLLFGEEKENPEILYDKMSLEELQSIDLNTLSAEEAEMVRSNIYLKERKKTADEGEAIRERVHGSKAMGLYNRQQNLLGAGHTPDQVKQILGISELLTMPDTEESLESGSAYGEGGYNRSSADSGEPIGEVESGGSYGPSTTVNNITNVTHRTYNNLKDEPTRG